MRARVTLDDELVRTARKYTGIENPSALITAALRALIPMGASRRLAALGGTEPELEDIKRTRVE